MNSFVVHGVGHDSGANAGGGGVSIGSVADLGGGGGCGALRVTTSSSGSASASSSGGGCAAITVNSVNATNNAGGSSDNDNIDDDDDDLVNDHVIIFHATYLLNYFFRGCPVKRNTYGFSTNFSEVKK